MKGFFSIFVLLLACSSGLASPLPYERHHGLSSILAGTVNDAQNFGKAKKAVIAYGSEALGEAANAAGNAALEYAVDSGNAALVYAVDSGNAALEYGQDQSNAAYDYAGEAGTSALNSVSDAGNAALEYAANIDPIEVRIY